MDSGVERDFFNGSDRDVPVFMPICFYAVCHPATTSSGVASQVDNEFKARKGTKESYYTNKKV